MLWTAKRSVAQPLMPLMEWTPIPICLLPENIGGIWLKCTCEGHWRRQFRELNDLKDRILAALRDKTQTEIRSGFWASSRISATVWVKSTSPSLNTVRNR